MLIPAAKCIAIGSRPIKVPATVTSLKSTNKYGAFSLSRFTVSAREVGTQLSESCGSLADNHQYFLCRYTVPNTCCQFSRDSIASQIIHGWNEMGKEALQKIVGGSLLPTGAQHSKEHFCSAPFVVHWFPAQPVDIASKYFERIIRVLYRTFLPGLRKKVLSNHWLFVQEKLPSIRRSKTKDR